MREKIRLSQNRHKLLCYLVENIQMQIWVKSVCVSMCRRRGVVVVKNQSTLHDTAEQTSFPIFLQLRLHKEWNNSLSTIKRGLHLLVVPKRLPECLQKTGSECRKIAANHFSCRNYPDLVESYTIAGF